MRLILIFWAIIGTLEVIRIFKKLYGSKTEIDEDTKRQMQYASGMLGKYAWIAIFFSAIFVFALSPFLIIKRVIRLIFKNNKKNEQN